MKKNKKNQINKIIKERILNAVQVGLDPKDVDQINVSSSKTGTHITIWTTGTCIGFYGNRYSRITPYPCKTEDEDDEENSED